MTSSSGWEEMAARWDEKLGDEEEPEPTEEFWAKDDQAPWIAEIPLHCVFEAWKVPLPLKPL